MIDEDLKVWGGFTGANTGVKWEDLEIELDEEMECKFFPSKTFAKVYSFVGIAMSTLFVLAYALRFLGLNDLIFGGGGLQTSRMMNSLLCDAAEAIAQIWNGGGTDICTKTEKRPGYTTRCIDPE